MRKCQIRIQNQRDLGEKNAHWGSGPLLRNVFILAGELRTERVRNVVIRLSLLFVVKKKQPQTNLSEFQLDVNKNLLTK